MGGDKSFQNRLNEEKELTGMTTFADFTADKGTFRKTLFVSDLDGTLLGPDARLSDASVSMLNDAIAKGALFSIATARTPSTVDILLDRIEANLPFIVMTGSAFWDKNTRLYSNIVTIHPHVAEKVISTFRAHGLPTFVYTLKEGLIDIYHYGALSEMEKKFIQERVNSPFKKFHIPEDGTSKLPSPLDDVVLFYGMQPSKETVSTYQDLCKIEGCNPLCYHDIYGEDTAILEVFSSAASKANAIRKLRKLTGAERVVVFGDNINDLPMMREADLAVAVENAVPEVKESANLVIGPNTSDSVARFILQSVMTD